MMLLTWFSFDMPGYFLFLQRLPFTLGFLGSMVGTIYVSMVLHSYVLSVLFSVIQVLALPNLDLSLLFIYTFFSIAVNVVMNTCYTILKDFWLCLFPSFGADKTLTNLDIWEFFLRIKEPKTGKRFTAIIGRSHDLIARCQKQLSLLWSRQVTPRLRRYAWFGWVRVTC